MEIRILFVFLFLDDQCWWNKIFGWYSDLVAESLKFQAVYWQAVVSFRKYLAWDGGNTNVLARWCCAVCTLGHLVDSRTTQISCHMTHRWDIDTCHTTYCRLAYWPSKEFFGQITRLLKCSFKEDIHFDHLVSLYLANVFISDVIFEKKYIGLRRKPCQLTICQPAICLHFIKYSLSKQVAIKSNLQKHIKL